MVEGAGTQVGLGRQMGIDAMDGNRAQLLATTNRSTPATNCFVGGIGWVSISLNFLNDQGEIRAVFPRSLHLIPLKNTHIQLLQIFLKWIIRFCPYKLSLAKTFFKVYSFEDLQHLRVIFSIMFGILKLMISDLS